MALSISATGELTLGDLLDVEELGLELVVDPEGWAAKPVVGAHSIEIDHPAAWLDRDWVMLTTGVHLSADPMAQRELIAELDGSGVAALGFGLDVAHHEVPKAILHEAEERALPIFTVPLQTAFRAVISAVYKATLSNEIRSANRLAAMQRFLMDALGEESPRSTVLQRLAALIEAPVAIITETGDVLISTRRVPGARIAAAVRGVSAPATAFEVEGAHGMAFAIDEPSAHEARWLVVVSPVNKALHPLTRAAAQTTLPLLAAMARLEESREAQDAAIRQATLETLLDLDDRSDAPGAAARAAAAGVDLSNGVQAVVAMDRSGQTDFMAMLTFAATEFSGPRKPSLATIREGKLIIVAGAPISDRVIADRLLAGNPTLSVGVGRHASDAFGVKQSVGDAELSVGAAARQRSGAIVRYEDLDFGTVLIHEVPLERLRPKMDQWLEPLREHPLILEALRAYFKYDLDVGRTARSLNLHPNSVRYRLARAEELINARLRSAETIIALYVALMSDDRTFGKSSRVAQAVAGEKTRNGVNAG
jgi:purine catabolism regulator